ncbi:MAG: hypothetical protein ABI718_08240 [Acidobacteriota bacterium]
MKPSELLAALGSGTVPRVILVGGDNEYLTEQAFTSIRNHIVVMDPSTDVEAFSDSTDLGSILDAYRTMSLFSARRLIVVPEVNAFVTKKEIASLYDKAVSDWTSAKTDRKRSSSLAKLMHLLGLIGADLDESDESIAAVLGTKKSERVLGQMLEQARASGRKPTRGEGDAALLAETIAHGGAPGTTLLLRSGEIPEDSATVALIQRVGAVVHCDLEREDFTRALDEAVRSLSRELEVTFDVQALTTLRQRLGIDRVLADKFSKEVPDLRLVIAEAERLATFAGPGGRVSQTMVVEQTQLITGGVRYEFASLFSEKKPVEAIAKLRDLVAQARREDSKTSVEFHYGRFLFPLADEIRQLICVQAFARLHKIDLRKSVPYNRFRDVFAEPLGEYLKSNSIVRQKPHPFALHKKFEAARNYSQETLLNALDDLAELEFARKSGGVPADIGLEAIVLTAAG